jgi:DME family drug/metabolite transporter
MPSFPARASTRSSQPSQPSLPATAGSPSQPPPSAAHPPAGRLSVLAAATLWGTTGTAASFAPAAASPLSIGAATMGFGGLLTLLFAGPSVLPVLRAGLRVLRWVLLGGLAVAVYPLAFYTAMDRAGVATGTVITIGSSPVFTAALERLLDGTRLRLRWLAATLSAGVGCTLLTLAAGHDSGGGGDVRGGVALGLLAGASYAAYTCCAARVIRAGYSSRAAMGSLFGLGALVLLPVLAAVGGPLLAQPRGVLVGAYLAVVPMFLAYVLFGAGLARITPSTATTLSLFEPVVAAVLGVTVVGERLGGWAWSGMALVLAGLFLLTAGRRR